MLAGIALKLQTALITKTQPSAWVVSLIGAVAVGGCPGPSLPPCRSTPTPTIEGADVDPESPIDVRIDNYAPVQADLVGSESTFRIAELPSVPDDVQLLQPIGQSATLTRWNDPILFEPDDTTISRPDVELTFDGKILLLLAPIDERPFRTETIARLDPVTLCSSPLSAESEQAAISVPTDSGVQSVAPGAGTVVLRDGIPFLVQNIFSVFLACPEEGDDDRNCAVGELLVRQLLP